MKRKIISLFSILVLFSSIFASAGFAKTGDPHKTLVSLGDSITAGYNLDNPTRDSFPSVIAKRENWELINLGVPGATTDHLLKALQTQEFAVAIKSADYISLNIGSNDLLIAYKQSGGNPVLLQSEINKMFTRLTLIISIIKQINPEAEIVLYNIYNAFQVYNPMHDASNLLLPTINEGYLKLANHFGLGYADAFTTFDGKQAKYLLPHPDIHPNKKGQMELAKIGSEAFQRLVKSPR